MALETPVPVADADVFLDAPPPKELAKQVGDTQTPAPAAQPAPPALGGKPAEVAPAAPPALSPHMVELAQSMGIPDAQQYSSDVELARAVRLAHSVRATTSQPETPKPAPTPAPALDLDVPEFDPSIYDPKLVQLAKALKGQKEHYEKQIKALQDALPQQIAAAYQQTQAAERGRRILTEALTEAGYDPARMDAAVEGKIVAMASAMIQQAQQMGLAVDRKALVKQALPIVMGAPSGPPRQPAPAAAPPNLEAQRAALAAEQRPRDDKGRFIPGAPTHRTVEGEGNGSHVRQMLMDLGVDPGRQTPKDDQDTFL